MVDQDRDPRVISPSTATRCLRQAFLKRAHDYYVEPRKQWAASVGTAVHGWLEERGEWSEKRLSTRLWYRGGCEDDEDIPITLSGQIDHYDPQTRTLTDYKTISSFQRYDPVLKRRVSRPLPDPAHVVQVNLYAYLLEANDYPVEQARIWYVRPDKEATRRLVPVPLWEADEAHEYVIGLVERVGDTIVTDRLPEPYQPDDPEYWQCAWCPVADICARRALDEDA